MVDLDEAEDELRDNGDSEADLSGVVSSFCFLRACWPFSSFSFRRSMMLKELGAFFGALTAELGFVGTLTGLLVIRGDGCEQLEDLSLLIDEGERRSDCGCDCLACVVIGDLALLLDEPCDSLDSLLMLLLLLV